MSQNTMITIQVFRFEPEVDEKPRYETYRVPHGPGFMVLDALHYIREKYDPTLRYRHSCHMGKCGSCAVSIDSRPGLACWELTYDGMRVEPLAGFPVIADLVIDRREINLQEEGLVFERKTPTPFDPHQIERLHIPYRKQIDEVRTCLHCFSCVSVCPYVYAEEKRFIGPKQMTEMAQHVYDPRLDKAQGLKITLHHGVWDCLACMACTKVCPQAIDARERIMDMRTVLMNTPELKGVPTNTRDLNQSLMMNGNPYGLARIRKGQWAEDLNVKDMTQGQRTETLYFSGCAQSQDPRDQEVARGLVHLFQKGGLDFGILGQKEGCCGDPARFTGEYGLFELIRDQNIDMIKNHGIQKIVTTCPHGFNLFRNEYGLENVGVKHYSQLLAEWIREGRLSFTRRMDKKVTYHDSCYLGRYNGVFNEPRYILQAIPGLELVEMKNHRENSLCCGGGGGGAFMDIIANPRLSWIRVRQAEETGAKILAVVCPLCRTMLEDAVKTLDLDMEVKHVSELVTEAL